MKQVYKVIGDIHGRSVWKDLVDPEAVNIFVGDYFDPYDRALVPELCIDNMHEILEFKKEHPGKVVLLLGNHDMHYWDGPRDSGCSRYNGRAAVEYHNIMRNNESLFDGVAYNIGDRYAVSHAGVSVYWYEAWKRYWDEKDAGGHPLWEYESMRASMDNLKFDKDRGCWMYGEEERHYSPGEVVDFCNRLWNKQDDRHFEFAFLQNQYYLSDGYGDSPTHGPLWIRPEALVKGDIFRGSDIGQVAGHTQMMKVAHVDRFECDIYFVDVLGQEALETKCLTINLEEDNG